MLLNPLLNKPPEDIHHIHLMGICGTGVGALAGMLKQEGFQISGSDQHIYPPMSDFLASQGITVQPGYSPENLTPRPDLVIVGNVITKKNPEALALAELAIPYLSMPQAVAHFFLKKKISLVVSGTHGKTTTSALLATMLHNAGLAPGFMIGGIVQAFASNFRVDSGRYFVVEGDEYDTAFFDKGPKFLHYQAHVAILTSIEFDHADIYDDLEAIKASFFQLARSMPTDGLLIAHTEDTVVQEIAGSASCSVQGYGTDPSLYWSLTDLTITPEGTDFSVHKEGNFFGRYHIALPGKHNALNSLAVIAVLHHIGLSKAKIAGILPNFPGVKRRQETRGIVNGIRIIDDFAHHPTAVLETLNALRGMYPDSNLVAIFEPRTNSSRRNVFQKRYTEVFGAADQVLIKQPDPLTNIAPEERFSTMQLVADLAKQDQHALHFETSEEIVVYLHRTSRSGDVLVFMSNGGFDNIHERTLQALAGDRP